MTAKLNNSERLEALEAGVAGIVEAVNALTELAREVPPAPQATDAGLLGVLVQLLKDRQSPPDPLENIERVLAIVDRFRPPVPEANPMLDMMNGPLGAMIAEKMFAGTGAPGAGPGSPRQAGAPDPAGGE